MDFSVMVEHWLGDAPVVVEGMMDQPFVDDVWPYVLLIHLFCVPHNGILCRHLKQIEIDPDSVYRRLNI